VESVNRPRWLVFLDYPEVLAIFAAGVLGLLLRRPFSFLDRHDAIDVALAALVFAAAWKLDLRQLAEARMSPSRWIVVLLVPAMTLPAASVAASLALPAGVLREGVSVAGLAPCEVASVAMAGMAGGQVTISAGILLGATVLSIATVGPILSLESSMGLVRFGTRGISISGHLARSSAAGPSLGMFSLVGTLLLVVVLPLLFGSLLGSQVLDSSQKGEERWLARSPLPQPLRLFREGLAVLGRALRRVSDLVSTVVVAILVALVACQVRLGIPYLVVMGVFLGFIGVSVVIGLLLGRRTIAATRRSILLSTSMRDFAIGAGIASSAFGPKAAAPLALYGILVLLWGMIFAGWARHNNS